MSYQDALIVYEEEAESKIEALKSMVSSDNIIKTPSLAIYRISPVFVENAHKDTKYPKVKLNEFNTVSSVDKKLDDTTLKNKFDIKDFANAENKESTIVEMMEEFEHAEDSNFDILKPDEDGERKQRDKLNLLKAFVYANDPYDAKSALDFEDDYNNSEIKFESSNERILNLLNI